MKNIFFIILFTLYGLINAIGQQFDSPFPISVDKYHVLDSAVLKCKYQLTYIKDTTKVNKKYTDIQVLQIGYKLSNYYSQYLIDYSVLVKELSKKQDGIPNSNGALGITIIKKFEDKELMTTDCGSDLRENFVYKEPIPSFEWIIENDTATVLTYLCQKASTTFRGRTYQAWFTMSIPISNGPWKFGGLPGLILKIYDTQQHYLFECISVEQLKQKEPILFYDLKYNSIKREDYNKLCIRFHNDIIPFYKARGGVVMEFDKNGKTIYLKEQKLPYNPLELE